MKRDMDLIRLLLLQVETGEAAPEVKQADPLLVAHHCALLIEAGFVEGQIVRNEKGMPHAAVLRRLKWEGHDFLDSTRDASVWAKVKEKALTVGGGLSFGLLLELAKAEVKSRLGLH